jgi:hypothetical protein
MDTIRRHSMVIGGDRAEADAQFEIRSPVMELLLSTPPD